MHRSRGAGQTPSQGHVARHSPSRREPSQLESSHSRGLAGLERAPLSRRHSIPAHVWSFDSLLGSTRRGTGGALTTPARHRSSRSCLSRAPRTGPCLVEVRGVTRAAIRRENATTHLPHTRCKSGQQVVVTKLSEPGTAHDEVDCSFPRSCSALGSLGDVSPRTTRTGRPRQLPLLMRGMGSWNVRLCLTARCTSATNPVAPGKASVIPPR